MSVTIAELKAQAEAEGVAQITGSDPQLADFWAKAHRYANDAGQCEVFDRIAEALDGPRRPVLAYFYVRVEQKFDHPTYGEVIGEFTLDIYGSKPPTDAEGWDRNGYWMGDIPLDAEQWWAEQYPTREALPIYMHEQAEVNAVNVVRELKRQAEREERLAREEAEIAEVVSQLTKKD